MCAIKFSCHKHHDSVQLTTFITNCVNKKKDVISFMKNCSKDSHVNHNNRQNSFHAIDRLKIQHIDILKLYFLNLTPMTKSSMISMDVKN